MSHSWELVGGIRIKEDAQLLLHPTLACVLVQGPVCYLPFSYSSANNLEEEEEEG